MRMLKEQYNPDALWFVDDVFTVSHKWLQEFKEEVIKQDAIIPFECITRAERLRITSYNVCYTKLLRVSMPIALVF